VESREGNDNSLWALQNIDLTVHRGEFITLVGVTGCGKNTLLNLILGSRVLVLSERPGRIAHEFKIDLPRPRNRMTEEFTKLFIKIRTALSGQLD